MSPSYSQRISYEAAPSFAGWEKALTYIDSRQKGKRLILVFDEFPYLAQKNKALLSVLQHLIDHTLQYGRLFIVLCGSYMGFMEKEVLPAPAPPDEAITAVPRRDRPSHSRTTP